MFSNQGFIYAFITLLEEGLPIVSMSVEQIEQDFRTIEYIIIRRTESFCRGYHAPFSYGIRIYCRKKK